MNELQKLIFFLAITSVMFFILFGILLWHYADSIKQFTLTNANFFDLILGKIFK